MWGSFLDKGKELAEKAKKAAEDLDKQLNESVGIETQQQQQTTELTVDTEDDDALNDAWADDEDDEAIQKPSVIEEEDGSGWDGDDVEFEEIDKSQSAEEAGEKTAQVVENENMSPSEGKSHVAVEQSEEVVGETVEQIDDAEAETAKPEASPHPSPQDVAVTDEEPRVVCEEETIPLSASMQEEEPRQEKTPEEIGDFSEEKPSKNVEEIQQEAPDSGVFGSLAKLAQTPKEDKTSSEGFFGGLSQLAQQISNDEENDEEVADHRREKTLPETPLDNLSASEDESPAHDEPPAEANKTPSEPVVIEEDTTAKVPEADAIFPEPAEPPIDQKEEIESPPIAETLPQHEDQQHPPYENLTDVLSQEEQASSAKQPEEISRIVEQQTEYTRIMEQKMEELQQQLAQREEQLFSKTEQMGLMENMFENEKQELIQKVQSTKEEAKRRIQKAKERVESMEQRLKNATASQSSSAEDVGKQAEIIVALREEGEKLARKQADMEAAVRSAKGETRELREQLEDSESANKTSLEKISSLQTELASTKEALASARHGESQADKLDSELRSVREESEKRAATILSLEQEVKELKVAQKELSEELEQTQKGATVKSKHEKEELMKEHSSLVSDLETKLRVSEREAAVREDALRHEVDELRKRWQDSVRRADSLSVDVQSSTAPLLRQLESTNKQNRARAAAWAELEKQLRTELEESVIQSEQLSKERSDWKTKATRLERSNKEYETELKQLKGSLRDKTEKVEQLERQLEEMEEEGAKMKAEWAEVERLANEGVSRVRSEMTRTVVDAEERHRIQVDSLEAQLRQEREQRSQLEKQVEGLVENAGLLVPTDLAESAAVVAKEAKPMKLRQSQGQAEILSGALGFGSDDEQSDDEDDDHDATNNGRSSFAALEQLTSRLKASKVELTTLRNRLEESEKTREELVQVLAESRSAREKLPLFEAKVKDLTAENQELTQEVQGLREDIVDVKEMYRTQLNVLVEQVAAAKSADDKDEAAAESNGESNLENSDQ